MDGASGWMNYYSDRLHQQSEKITLERGQDYLLVSEFAENSGNDYINVRLNLTLKKANYSNLNV